MGFVQVENVYIISRNSSYNFSFLKNSLVQIHSKSNSKQWALSIRPKIPEIPGRGANGADIFRNSFRNFGCTSRGWPKIPENRNNRKILSRIRPFLLGPVSPSPEIEQHGGSFLSNLSANCSSRLLVNHTPEES